MSELLKQPQNHFLHNHFIVIKNISDHHGYRRGLVYWKDERQATPYQ